MIKHYCDICGIELVDDSVYLRLDTAKVPTYETEKNEYTCVASSSTYIEAVKKYRLYEICQKCADKITSKCGKR